MVGHVDPQRDLYTCDNQYLKYVGEDTFYGFLARHGSQLFRDDDFASFYTLDNGRTSVPPSILAKALLLQSYNHVSDAEAVERYDLRWKVALGWGAPGGQGQLLVELHEIVGEKVGLKVGGVGQQLATRQPAETEAVLQLFDDILRSGPATMPAGDLSRSPVGDIRHDYIA